jgi:hypothetical protein
MMPVCPKSIESAAPELQSPAFKENFEFVKNISVLRDTVKEDAAGCGRTGDEIGFHLLGA